MDWLTDVNTAAQVGSTEQWVAWLYVATNSFRVLSYVPQIRAVLKAQDGAAAISITTWGFWTFANATATLYGWLVVQDSAFCAIFIGNLACTAAVTLIAIRRRLAKRASHSCLQANGASPG